MKTKHTDSKPEIGRQKLTWCDFYSGTKAALVNAGICRAEWFPAKLALDRKYKKPRTVRTYKTEHKGLPVSLKHRTDAYGNVFWEVEFGIPDGEMERRKEERQRVLEEEEKERYLRIEARREAETAAAESVEFSNSVKRGNGWNVLLALSESDRKTVFALASKLYARRDDTAMTMPAHLRLVVDNGPVKPCA